MANMTPATLAYDIINRGQPKACQYAPTGSQAEKCAKFLGRKLGHELFVTENQVKFFEKLLGGAFNANIITDGTGDSRFAAFIRSIWSDKKRQTYYILVFGGYVPESTEETAPAPVAVDASKAHLFAAKLICGAIEKNYHKPDEYATPEARDSYLCAWLSKGQADALAKLLSGLLKADGSFPTQAAGCFAYWGKKRLASGAQLICWMGEPQAEEATEAAPVANVPPGKRIPLDAEIPF